jgi:hypothetical protein
LRSAVIPTRRTGGVSAEVRGFHLLLAEEGDGEVSGGVGFYEAAALALSQGTLALSI